MVLALTSGISVAAVSAKRLTTTLVMFAVLSSPTLAMTITNTDTGKHTVTIITGDKEVEHALPAGAVLEDVCDEGCVVSIAGFDDEIEVESDDTLTIKAGQLHKDEQD